MFKFVHIADCHLDSAIVSNEKDKKLILEEMENAFRASVNLCIEENCHALLISGDLFDDEHLSFKTELMLRECFDRLAKKNIKVFYCLGNHDPRSSKIRKFKLGDNVHIFDNEEPEIVQVTDSRGNVIGLVTGVGYSTKHVDYNLAKKFKLHNTNVDAPIVGMLHTSLDVGGDAKYAPCKYDDLLKHNYDYWALGHIHKTLVYGNDRPAVFPGCTCGRDFGETGKKGGYLVELDKDRPSKYEFIELAQIEWYDKKVDGFDEANEANDMLNICQMKINNNANDSKTNIVRLTLSGQCPIYDCLSDEALDDLQESLSRSAGAKVTLVNKLSSLINPQDYINDKHLLAIALNMAKDAKEDDELKAQIIEIIDEKYKGLDGGDKEEYVDSLFDNIDKRLCDVMIKQDY